MLELVAIDRNFVEQLGFVSDDTPKDVQITILNVGRKPILVTEPPMETDHGFLTGPARRDLSEDLVVAGFETGFA